MISLIRDAHQMGLLGSTVHEVFPAVDKKSVDWRLYFTLPCAINYQRNSERMWRSALATFRDPETAFVYDCKNIYRGEHAYRQALAKHALAVQREKHPRIWYTLASTLALRFKGDPDQFFAENGYDVLRVKKYVAENKDAFPYVSGPKLLNYWLYIYSYFTDVKFVNRQHITVIPDVHVKRASVALGIVDEKTAENTEEVAERWDELLDGTGIAPCDLHAPLWRWSRAGMPTDDQLVYLLSKAKSHSNLNA